jgi:outer membrane protein assembly factor BamD
MIAHFYYMRESWPAAIARFKSLTDTYPLYSGADEALYELGNSYMRETELLRRSKLAEAAKAPLLKTYTDQATSAYDQILTRYPLEDRAVDARKQLEAMGKPVPKATPEAIAQNKKEQDSRGSLGTYQKMMLNFKKGPDVSEAVTVGEPTLVDPKQSSAPEIVRAATASVVSALNAATNATAKPGTGTAPPPENAAVPRSDAPTAPAAAGTGAAASGTTLNSGVEVVNKPPANNADSAIPELGNDLTPPASKAAGAAAPPLPPTQVNDAPKAAPAGDTPAASTSAAATPATAADPTTESSSKKKKKKHLLVF